MPLIVSPLSQIATVIAMRKPSHMVTLLDPATVIDTPAGLTPDRHLRLGVNDISEQAEGLISPDEALVRRLLTFGRTWDETAPMLIHCWAGISRSSAAAFVLACERSPKVDALDIALHLRRASPTATPNRRIVALADAMLGRDGEMIEAAARIGTGAFAFEGTPFDLPARF